MTLIKNKQRLFVLTVVLLLVVVVLVTGASLHLFHLPFAYIMASTSNPDVISHSHQRS